MSVDKTGSFCDKWMWDWEFLRVWIIGSFILSVAMTAAFYAAEGLGALYFL